MTTSPTDTPKRLSDVELAKISVRSQEKFSSEYFTARDAHRDRCALLSHIAALTAPPSQGKVERARELLASAYNEIFVSDGSKEALIRDGKNPSIPANAAISAITQALTESSGQGTDGALVKRTLDMLSFYLNRPGVDHEKRTPLTTEITDRECLEIANVLRDCARAIERLSAPALPLLGRNAVLQEARCAIAPKATETNKDVFLALTDACAKIEALKSKQPDTGAGK